MCRAGERQYAGISGETGSSHAGEGDPGIPAGVRNRTVPARISQYLHGVYQPQGDAILRLAEALGVSAMWLMGEDCPDDRIRPAGANAGLPDNLLPLQLRRYPLLGDIACGKPIVAQDNGDSYVSAADTEAGFLPDCKGRQHGRGTHLRRG